MNMAKSYTIIQRDFIDRVLQTATAIGLSPAQVALSWILDRPDITAPIVGVLNVKHLKELVGVLDYPLAKRVVTYLEEEYVPHEVAGNKVFLN